MVEIFCSRIAEVRREKRLLERMLKSKLIISGRKIEVVGDALVEYDAVRVFEAISMGFKARTAILLLDETVVFEVVYIKDLTRRKNLEVVRGRIIGAQGRTRRTLEQISGCVIKVKDNAVGIIGAAEDVEYAVTAVGSIARGAKQTNAYKYLERINTARKRPHRRVVG